MSRTGEGSDAGPGSAAEIAQLHVVRSLDALRREAAERLQPILGAAPAALVNLTSETRGVVEVALNDGPWRAGENVETDSWDGPAVHRMALDYEAHVVGELRFEGDLPADRLERLEVLARHLTVAFVNLHLNERALASTEHYCASLQALEEGVALFQECDRDAIGARFLALMNSLLETPVGALFLLEEIGNPKSKLVLHQVQGMPEAAIDQLVTTDGTWWPTTIVDHPAGFVERHAEDGTFADLDPTSVPAPLTNMVHCALRYHGICVGVALAINAPTAARGLRVERARRLSELGAALFHRLFLERESLRKREMDTQLAIAATVQRRLIPTDPPKSPAYSFAWQSQPAAYVGGDYIELIGAESGDVFAIVADVSGHGIDSALLMASCRSAYRADCARTDQHVLLEHLNREVHNEVGDTGMFITAASLQLHADGRTCTYASAGHNAVLHYRARTGSVELLESTGPSLGMFPGMDYDTGSTALEPDDVLFLYTDGIVEATNDDDEMFGDDRLVDTIRAHGTESADAILAAVHAELDEFIGSRKVDDDVSSIVVKVAGEADGATHAD